MKCYTVKKEERYWDDNDIEILGNKVYLNREDAVKAADYELESYVGFHEISPKKRIGDGIHKGDGRWYASTRGKSMSLEIEKHQLIG